MLLRSWEKCCLKWGAGVSSPWCVPEPPLDDENSWIQLSQHLLLASALHNTCSPTHSLFLYHLSRVFGSAGGFFERSPITIATNECAHIVSRLCQGALEEARAGLYLRVLVFTVRRWLMKCYTCSCLHRGHSWFRLSMRTQFTKHNSQISFKQGECLNQFMKHLPSIQPQKPNFPFSP